MTKILLQSRECLIQQMDSELQALLSRNVSSAEDILFSGETQVKRHSGLSNNCAQIVTNRQLILAQTNHYVDLNYLRGSEWRLWAAHSAIKELGTRYGYSDVRTLFLQEISSIQDFPTSITNCFLIRILGRTDKGMDFLFGSPDISARFLEIIRIATISPDTPSSDNSSINLQRLRELASLHKEGIISDQEYEKKRKEILEKL